MSKTIARITASFSNAAALRKRNPSLAARPDATMTATGVASPNAQGHATTRTLTSASSPRASRISAGASIIQAANVINDTTRIAGTKTEAMRSAVRAIRAFVDCASSTITITRARTVSFDARVATTSSTPSAFIVPATTRSPARLTTGSGSPVSIDASISLSPRTTSPSTGTRSPGRIRTRMPGVTSSTGISRSVSRALSISITRTNGTTNAPRARIASLARAVARASSNRPSNTKTRMIAAASNQRCDRCAACDGVVAISAHTLAPYATVVPSETSVCMSVLKCRAR